MKKRLEEEVREIFTQLIDEASSLPGDVKEANDDLARTLDRKITEELAIALMSRWLILARARKPDDVVAEFTRIYHDNRAQGEGAIVAIVRLLNELGDGRKPSAPMIGGD